MAATHLVWVKCWEIDALRYYNSLDARHLKSMNRVIVIMLRISFSLLKHKYFANLSFKVTKMPFYQVPQQVCIALKSVETNKMLNNTIIQLSTPGVQKVNIYDTVWNVVNYCYSRSNNNNMPTDFKCCLNSASK